MTARPGRRLRPPRTVPSPRARRRSNASADRSLGDSWAIIVRSFSAGDGATSTSSRSADWTTPDRAARGVEPGADGPSGLSLIGIERIGKAPLGRRELMPKLQLDLARLRLRGGRSGTNRRRTPPTTMSRHRGRLGERACMGPPGKSGERNRARDYKNRAATKWRWEGYRTVGRLSQPEIPAGTRNKNRSSRMRDFSLAGWRLARGSARS